MRLKTLIFIVQIIGNKRRMRYYKNRHWLKKKYVVDDLMIKEIANLCVVSTSTITFWLKRFDIKKGRKISSERQELRVWVSPSLYETILIYCKRKNISMCSIIRMALVEFLIRNNFNPYKEKNV